MDLYIVHLLYITACVSTCYYMGYRNGKQKGSRQTLNMLIADRLLSADRLEKFYGK